MMTAVPLDHPEGGGYQVRVGVSSGESLLAPGARPGHNRYVLAWRRTLGSAASGTRALLAPGSVTGVPVGAGLPAAAVPAAAVPAAAVPAAAIMSTSIAIDLISPPFLLITVCVCRTTAGSFPR